jgi:ATP-dependent DNA helicase RecG
MLQGVSKVRNHVIARVFREIGLIEQWGSGIPRMVEEAKKLGLPEPELLEIGMRVRCIVRFAEELVGSAPKPSRAESQPESRPESRPESGPESGLESSQRQVASASC